MRENKIINTIETERLYLRQWQASDFAPFAEMNANPKVMAYFPKLLTTSMSNTIAKKCQSLIDDNGWGFWAVSLKETDAFIGMVGLNNANADMPFSPAVEIAWRLDNDYWGLGYATEAARASLNFAFVELGIEEVVSFTAVINKRSQLVMERLGMTNTQENFYHPMINPNHRLAEHVLYKMTRQQWQDAVLT
ncbi:MULTISPECIES: GNAT family N-acetyltransferase [Psychrobacter]|jgi:RimJ/RimL family protein N-acetyltransferase|uniref:GNAT family N-acetyltransferase n=1 Tax=Psychrobacter TaxID=497 RepID=UPI00086F77ED|nr:MULTISPECIES: GNAT family N-acetyltransferase [Psychrobacter]MBA6245649.1 GNAT family N-acetyltransferase [Psychrobacter sp. Urea-trap-18]MBA6286389.1 GNAT family N-acetyltransferase [Psychrobacter sp. Urea-trap-16]MBA6317192.1 GNAT family N-acetyltransferase [Psychrobacter sp. Urea-trap-20]MBA6333451.1 GNAT family N-acetyltransferase [Psychrobacter sp. Urea-trap-19]OEH67285.1 MAG: GCN5 family acetyltransferase [Psychrobacter sp. B29-1]|tara:strand:+ start:12299 stop:12874 length:576 start_codon:yes stop_codon:yes gene_type:complete